MKTLIILLLITILFSSCYSATYRYKAIRLEDNTVNTIVAHEGVLISPFETGDSVWVDEDLVINPIDSNTIMYKIIKQY